MYPTWKEVWEFAWANHTALTLGAITVITAFIKTAPEPGKPFSLYAWMYDGLHQLMNISNTRLNPTVNPDPPHIDKPTS
jgi:hypothetical protein